jgi:hypothetical protein
MLLPDKVTLSYDDGDKKITFEFTEDISTSTIVEHAAKLLIASGHHHENVAKGMNEYLWDIGFYKNTEEEEQ